MWVPKSSPKAWRARHFTQIIFSSRLEIQFIKKLCTKEKKIQLLPSASTYEACFFFSKNHSVTADSMKRKEKNRERKRSAKKREARMENHVNCWESWCTRILVRSKKKTNNHRVNEKWIFIRRQYGTPLHGRLCNTYCIEK